MTQAMETEDFLEHYGVKGMKWGVIRARRRENKLARAETRKAVNDVYRKPLSNKDDDIVTARKSLPDAEQRRSAARDQYKINKQTMNRIEAKRDLKVKTAELRRVQEQATKLTKDEQDLLDLLDAGRAVVDAFTKPDNRRDLSTKISDRQRDRNRIVNQGIRKAQEG